MTAVAERDIADVAMAIGAFPETVWLHGDDACDCTFQRIGLWKNPYLGETLQVRMCCIWGELYRLFPQFVKETPAYLDGENEWLIGQRAWDGEGEMPRALWHRQLARRYGRPLPEIRAEFADAKPPAGVPRERDAGEEGVDPLAVLFEMVTGLASEVARLREALRAD